MAIQTSHIYKVFRSGIYLGLIKNVTSPFTFSQQINTVGASLDIIVSINSESALQTVEQLTDEVGNPLTDESGNPLFPDSMPVQFGSFGNNVLYQTGNDVQVWEISQYFPNGHQVFAGKISRWQNNDGAENTIQLTVLSYGADLANYLVQGAETIDQVQSYYNTGNNGVTCGLISGTTHYVGQTVQTGVYATNISAVAVALRVAINNGSSINYNDAASTTVTLGIYTNSASTSPLGTATITITNNSWATYKFTFSSPIATTTGTSYFIRISSVANISNSITVVGYSVASGNGGELNLYSTGLLYFGTGTPTPISWSADPGNASIYFNTYFKTTATNAPYFNQDPRDILLSVLNNYVSQGGGVTVNGANLIATGVQVSTQFKVNTTHEASQTCLSFAPYNFYMYVDVASNTFYFKPTNTVADFTLIKGRHITTLDLLSTAENIKNNVYFTGGQLSTGQNLFAYLQDAQSIANYGIGLERLSDTRVVDKITAEAILQAYVNRFKNPVYQTSVTVMATTCDISQFKPGWMIGFAGFGDFRDQLLLQCVSITPNPDSIQLQLGSLPKRAGKQIDDINRALTAQQVLDNPAVTS